MAAPFPIVAIGAVAGRDQTLLDLLRAIPADSRIAFVVVANMEPEHWARFVAVLDRETMPVVVARAGVPLEPARVHLVSPEDPVLIRGGALKQPRDRKRIDRSLIDAFFLALAEDLGPDAVAIMLAGNGHDGIVGIRAIREQGGLVIAEVDPDSYSPDSYSMVEAPPLVASSLADLVLPASEIPKHLLAHTALFQEDVADPRAPSAASLLRIYRALRTAVGHDFSRYKDKTFIRRIVRRAQLLRLPSVDDYPGCMENDADEARLLFRDLLIGVTGFFRDREAFEILAESVVPALFEAVGDGPMRIWVPGCATGEEAYSIAILLREQAERVGHADSKIQIFATDIDERALAAARLGRYPRAALADMSPERMRFFTSENGVYRIVKELREMCVFSVHSVIKDPPFSRIDLISCRNLLIYFNASLQAQLLPIFHYALRPGGHLFLGSSENVSQAPGLFSPLHRKYRIFQRQDHVRPKIDFPTFTPAGPDKRPAEPRDGDGTPAGAIRAAEAAILDRHAPAFVVVTEDAQIVHYSARTGRYLEPPSGPPSKDLFAMARRGLRLDLQAVLNKALETGSGVTRDDVTFEQDGNLSVTSITVEPIVGAAHDRLYLIIFGDPVKPVAPDPAPLPLAEPATRLLERELRITRERLQRTVEEFETSNEELKSSNEELVSINEEMQSTNEEIETSKEEIQSINEELQVVNGELSGKVEDLARANDDLRNLFDSTQIATIFLDRNLTVRTYTSAVSDIFRLIPSDRGRPLSDIVSMLDHDGLTADVAHVLDNAVSIERDVRRHDGSASYLMRILPYRMGDGSVDGILLTFVDVSRMVRAEEHQRLLVSELNHRVRNMLATVTAMARLTVTATNSRDGFLETFLGRIEAMSMTYAALSRDNWAGSSLEAIIRGVVEPQTAGRRQAVSIAGARLLVKPRAALTLGMALHELADNAAKHGALSRPQGEVNIAWNIQPAVARPSLALRWVERGGPPIEREPVPGFGMELVSRGISYELGGRSNFVPSSEGAEWYIEIPFDDLFHLPEGLPKIQPNRPVT
jgi:two-component system CheB/CheR fusion protein